jgi:hypothetical protein
MGAVAEADGKEGKASAQGYGQYRYERPPQMAAKVQEGEFGDHYRPLPMAFAGLIRAALMMG